MDKPSIRNYFAVAVAGMFSLLNANIVSAQTATNLICSNCVGPGEVAPDTVDWYRFSPSARVHLTNQANDIAALKEQVAALQAMVATLQANSVPNLGTYLRIDESNPQRPTAWFEAVNVMVVNGTGTTSGATNGVGNLIVGYDEFEGDPDDNKSGSHNLVVGPEHNYSSHSGFVAGVNNNVLAEYATVIGGISNTASGIFSSVSGGNNNFASGEYSRVSGGVSNWAAAIGSSVSGGAGNTASGNDSSISGGAGNTALGELSSLSGGFMNTASGQFSSVSGGSNNTASGTNSSVSGGNANTASGTNSSVSGGNANTASGIVSSVSGGNNRTASGNLDWVAGALFQDF